MLIISRQRWPTSFRPVITAARGYKCRRIEGAKTRSNVFTGHVSRHGGVVSDRAWVISCLRGRSRRRFSFTSHDRPACFNAEITVRGEELQWLALQNARMVGGVHATATPPASNMRSGDLSSGGRWRHVPRAVPRRRDAKAGRRYWPANSACLRQDSNLRRTGLGGRLKVRSALSAAYSSAICAGFVSVLALLLAIDSTNRSMTHEARTRRAGA